MGRLYVCFPVLLDFKPRTTVSENVICHPFYTFVTFCTSLGMNTLFF